MANSIVLVPLFVFASVFATVHAQDEDTVRQYERTSIAETVHNDWPFWGRQNFKGEEVSRDFAPDDQDYQESVGLCAVPPIVFGALVLLFFSFRCVLKCICGCLCGKKSDDDDRDHNYDDDDTAKPKRHPHKPGCLLKGFAALVVLAMIALLFFGMASNDQVSKKMDDVWSALRQFDDNTEANIVQLQGVQSYLRNVNDDVTTLTTRLSTACPVCVNNTNYPTNDLEQVDANLESGVSSVQSGIDEYSNVVISDHVDDADSFEEKRHKAQLSVLVLLIVPFLWLGLIMVMKTSCAGSCKMSTFVLYSVIVGFIGWIVTGVEASACVLIADMCYAPNDFIAREAGKQDAQTADMALFYSSCNATSVSPFQDDLDSASTALTDSRAPMVTIQEYIDDLNSSGMLSSADYAALTSDLDTIFNQIDAGRGVIDGLIATVFSCVSIHNIYVDSLTAVCGDGLEGLVGLVVVQGILAFKMLFAIFFLLRFTRYLRESGKDLTPASYKQEKDAPVYAL